MATIERAGTVEPASPSTHIAEIAKRIEKMKRVLASSRVCQINLGHLDIDELMSLEDVLGLDSQEQGQWPDLSQIVAKVKMDSCLLASLTTRLDSIVSQAENHLYAHPDLASFRTSLGNIGVIDPPNSLVPLIIVPRLKAPRKPVAKAEYGQHPRDRYVLTCWETNLRDLYILETRYPEGFAVSRSYDLVGEGYLPL